MVRSKTWTMTFAGLIFVAACSDDAGGEGGDVGETGNGDGDGDGDGDPSTGDGDGDTPSSCTMLPPPIAQGSFDAGAGGVETPGSIHVLGELLGGTGPFIATWNGGVGLQKFDSPELASSPAQWDADFEYSPDTGWAGQCPPESSVCHETDELSFSFRDKHTDEQRPYELFAQASLCVDINRVEPVCPLPVALASVSATPDPNDPTTLEFQVALTNPQLDCAGLEPTDGLTYKWTIDDGGEGVVVETATAAATFSKSNVLGEYFRGSVEVVCVKTVESGGDPETLDLRASTEFYVDCH